MGFGGLLIWTGVFRNINVFEKKPILVAGKPQLTDLLRGRLFNSEISYQNNIIFKHNPRLIFNKIYSRNSLDKGINSRFLNILNRFAWLTYIYEYFVFRLSEIISKHLPYHIVHIDLLIHSYVIKILPNKYIWDHPIHWIAYMSNRFLSNTELSNRPELFFHIDEKEDVDRLIQLHNISKPFIIIEFNSKPDYFGTLRNWPIQRWQAIVNRLAIFFPSFDIVQAGLSGSSRLYGTIDLCGKTTFRQCVLLTQKATLFLGSEGGLMHGARSVNANAIIIWGGISLPDFGGYLDHQRVVCKYVQCAPCGNLGWCNNDHICMKDISVEEVWEQVYSFLAQVQI